MLHDLTPADRAAFAAALAPCLALAGGAGMGGEARREWLHAAWLALGEAPADLLRRGARAALRGADHPSRIVPAIMAEIGADWERRRRMTAARDPVPAPALEPPGYCTPAEAAAILRRHGLDKSA